MFSTAYNSPYSAASLVYCLSCKLVTKHLFVFQASTNTACAKINYSLLHKYNSNKLIFIIYER